MPNVRWDAVATLKPCSEACGSLTQSRYSSCIQVYGSVVRRGRSGLASRRVSFAPWLIKEKALRDGTGEQPKDAARLGTEQEYMQHGTVAYWIPSASVPILTTRAGHAPPEISLRYCTGSKSFLIDPELSQLMSTSSSTASASISNQAQVLLHYCPSTSIDDAHVRVRRREIMVLEHVQLPIPSCKKQDRVLQLVAGKTKLLDVTVSSSGTLVMVPRNPDFIVPNGSRTQRVLPRMERPAMWKSTYDSQLPRPTSQCLKAWYHAAADRAVIAHLQGTKHCVLGKTSPSSFWPGGVVLKGSPYSPVRRSTVQRVKVEVVQ